MKSIKLYPVGPDSLLYNIGSKRRLCEVLKLSRLELECLLVGNFYKVGMVLGKNGKQRLTQQPIGLLRRVHDRIQMLLSRLESSAYLHSGKKGKSAITNAQSHLGNATVLTMDINSFFQSCTERAVFQFFVNKMNAAHDIAGHLATICTYNGHIPTGSPLSMSLAYWSYQPTFERVALRAANQNITFSLYVDDMSFSSSKVISKKFTVEINGELKRANLKCKPSKTKWFQANEPKLVTGVILTPEGALKVPNKRRHDIVDILETVKSPVELDPKSAKSLLGKICSARQLEANFRERDFQLLRQLEQRNFGLE